jgi:nucleotide-binding universal stress UspA family protein
MARACVNCDLDIGAQKMKILLAVDGSSYTKKMLAYLATHDDLFTPASEYVVFTVQPVLPPRARAVVGKDIVDQYYREEAEKILAPVTKFLLRHGIDAKSEWRAGHVGETIAKFAESGKFDLVILGSHGHGALVNLVMGSVTTQVLAHCRVPLLLVR